MQNGVNGQVAVRHVIRAEKRRDQERAINIAKMLRTAILYKQQAAMGMIVQVRNIESIFSKTMTEVFIKSSS